MERRAHAHVGVAADARGERGDEGESSAAPSDRAALARTTGRVAREQQSNLVLRLFGAQAARARSIRLPSRARRAKRERRRSPSRRARGASEGRGQPRHDESLVGPRRATPASSAARTPRRLCGGAPPAPPAARRRSCRAPRRRARAPPPTCSARAPQAERPRPRRLRLAEREGGHRAHALVLVTRMSVERRAPRPRPRCARGERGPRADGGAPVREQRAEVCLVPAPLVLGARMRACVSRSSPATSRSPRRAPARPAAFEKHSDAPGDGARPVAACAAAAGD